MQYYKKDKKATYILLASIILHVIALIIFFNCLYDFEYEPFLKKAAPIVLKSPRPKPKPKTKPKPPKPIRAVPAFQGLQGASSPKPQPQMPPKQIKPQKEKEQPQQKIKEPKTPAEPKEKKEVQTKKLLDQTKKMLAKMQRPKPPPKQKKEEKPKPESKKKIEILKPPPPPKKKLTLSDLSKGFLKFSQQQGANLVRYTQSAKGIPTEEQLKHERYVSKILACIQTNLKIKRNTISFLQPVSHSQILVLDVNLILQHTGELFGLTIINSSGKFEFDQFMKQIIADASNSFPPVPSYLSTNTYLIPIRFIIPAGAVMR